MRRFRTLAVAITSSVLISGMIAAPVLAATKDTSGRGKDYRTFHVGNKVEYGKIGDSYTANLVMYLAGNQFMVMQDLIQDFQKKNPDIKTVYVETIPPGQIVKQQLLKQGKIEGQKTSMNPDLYASVGQTHIRILHSKGLMDDYMTYIHNKLELMVAKGNPKHVKGPRDLGRSDLVQSQPNPLTEGIFSIYGSRMLKELGLYKKVTGDKKCAGCWAVPGKTWFTVRHHRDTPYRIEHGMADVGIVWASEVKYAESEGRKLSGVPIPAPYNMAHKVNYNIGPLKAGRNTYNAVRFMAYLATPAAQNIYAKYGFEKAKKKTDLKLTPIR